MPTDVDLAELRLLAEAATPSPWASQATEHDPANALVYGPDGDSFATLFYNPGNDYDPVATAAYIAAANPQTILALLDRIEAYEKAQAATYRVGEALNRRSSHD